MEDTSLYIDNLELWPHDFSSFLIMWGADIIKTALLFRVSCPYERSRMDGEKRKSLLIKPFCETPE